MAAIADIVVKRNDGVTNVTFTATQGSGGDRQPATWYNTASGTARAFRTMFRLFAQDNGTKTARRVTSEYVYPYTVTGADGKISIADRIIIRMEATVPNGVPTAYIDDSVAEALNLLAATHVKVHVQQGFAPT